jgi:hypothetical protein
MAFDSKFLGIIIFLDQVYFIDIEVMEMFTGMGSSRT